MGFFKREKHDASPNYAAFADPLVAGLVSNHESAFLSALQEADSLSERGDYRGIRAIREAIRIRSGKETVDFTQPGDTAPNPAPELLTLAKKRALLDQPGISRRYITSLLFLHRFDPGQAKVSRGHITDATYWRGGGVLGKLLGEIVRAGGPGAGYEFRLLCYEMGAHMKLMDACTRTGNWDQFLSLGD